MEAADAQFSRLPYLHFPKTHQRWIRPFLTFAKADAKDGPIARWVRESYDPVRLKDWLESKGYVGAFKDIYPVPPTGNSKW